MSEYIHWKDKLGKFMRRDVNAPNRNGETLLQIAIKKRDTLRVLSLLNQGADPNLSNNGHNNRPLTLALLGRQHEISDLLIKHGAHLDDLPHGYSYLSTVVMNGDIRGLKMLIRKGISPTLKDRWTEETPYFHLSDGASTSISLLKNHNVPINSQNTHGQTPLRKFIAQRQYKICMSLIAAGADPTIFPQGAKSPLMFVMNDTAKKDDPAWEVAKKLVEAGADAHTLNQKGQTLYQMAIELQDFTSLYVFRTKMNVSTRDLPDSQGNLPIHTAIKTKNTAIIQSVLHNTPTISTIKNRVGKCPMETLVDMDYYQHCSGNQGALEILQAVLDHGGDPDTKDNNGMTLLHHAIIGHNDAMIDLLLKAGADTNILSPHGLSPLQMAVSLDNLEMVDDLLDHKANPNITTEKGWTILDTLARDGDRHSCIVQRLISAGGVYNKQLPANTHIHPEQKKENPQNIIKKELPLKFKPNKP